MSSDGGRGGSTAPTADDGGGRLPPDADRAPRSARWLVAVILAALLVPGVIGFDLWPLTGWRLFSRTSGPCRERWVIEAVDADGRLDSVGFEELPQEFRQAEWEVALLAGMSVPLDEDCPPPAPRDDGGPDGASAARRDEVCEALLREVVTVRPATVELRLVRDPQRLVEDDRGWVVTNHPEVFHTCPT